MRTCTCNVHSHTEVCVAAANDPKVLQDGFDSENLVRTRTSLCRVCARSFAHTALLSRSSHGDAAGICSGVLSACSGPIRAGHLCFVRCEQIPNINFFPLHDSFQILKSPKQKQKTGYPAAVYRCGLVLATVWTFNLCRSDALRWKGKRNYEQPPIGGLSNHVYHQQCTRLVLQGAVDQRGQEGKALCLFN